MEKKPRVIIAGIAGASLGTELFKCLALAKRYEIFGCDISPYAYGHYQKGFRKTFIVNENNYIDSVISVCKKNAIDFLVPGGEQPMVLLGKNENLLKDYGIQFVGNSADIIQNYSDKKITFRQLQKRGFEIPETLFITRLTKSIGIPLPCIIKPSTNSGGSNFVFLASTIEEAKLYLRYLKLNNRNALIQEYIPVTEGEFTVGVLSMPDKTVAYSIALKKIFNSKLSIAQQNNIGLISSGYSQGYIDTFPTICSTAEKIAKSIGSRGPLNIQGRVRGGVFLPFEINPRFSASTYLRALAGLNEIDIFLQFLITGKLESIGPIQPGYYLRSFDEVVIEKNEVKQ
jgi:carbamoyl-phosphate synthase large subunit